MHPGAPDHSLGYGPAQLGMTLEALRAAASADGGLACRPAHGSKPLPPGMQWCVDRGGRLLPHSYHAGYTFLPDQVGVPHLVAFEVVGMDADYPLVESRLRQALGPPSEPVTRQEAKRPGGASFVIIRETWEALHGDARLDRASPAPGYFGLSIDSEAAPPLATQPPHSPS